MDAPARTRTSVDAERRYQRALLAYLRATDESIEPLDALIADRPDFVPARLLGIGKAVAAKHAGVLGDLEQALEAVRPLEGSATGAERASLTSSGIFTTSPLSSSSRNDSSRRKSSSE